MHAADLIHCAFRQRVKEDCPCNIYHEHATRTCECLALQGLAAIGALGFLLMIELFPPRWGELIVWTVLYGVPVGVGLSFWKHKNEQHKAENTEKVSHVL